MYQLQHWRTNALVSSVHAWCARLLQEPTLLREAFFRIAKFADLANTLDRVIVIFKMLFRTNVQHIFIFIQLHTRTVVKYYFIF